MHSDPKMKKKSGQFIKYISQNVPNNYFFEKKSYVIFFFFDIAAFEFDIGFQILHHEGITGGQLIFLNFNQFFEWSMDL